MEVSLSAPVQDPTMLVLCQKPGLLLSKGVVNLCDWGFGLVQLLGRRGEMGLGEQEELRTGVL
jgi:hypothetical protein